MLILIDGSDMHLSYDNKGNIDQAVFRQVKSIRNVTNIFGDVKTAVTHLENLIRSGEYPDCNQCGKYNHCKQTVKSEGCIREFRLYQL